MSLSPGTRLGPYEIVSALGAGGMGEVYRARDSKLKREVAIKVLPADLAGDRERLARFQREAEVLASLNHPHIAQIYGIEEGTPKGGPYDSQSVTSKGVPYDGLAVERFTALVMELVEGEDLSQRIARGAIPLDEALPIARQIAEALEAAHEQGIIHRDLKPANIKVRPDGAVKVLDFGLAKAIELSEPKGSAPQAATITTPAMTMRGMILGTAAYMSPEQAKGKAVDKRADIWAFGCVLYEMLTGKRAFEGEDVTDTLTSVMRDTPEWKALPADTPVSIRVLLRQCIDKDPRRRAPHIGVARLAIDDALLGTGELIASHPPPARRSPALRIAAWAAAAVAIAAVAAATGYWAARRGAPAPSGTIYRSTLLVAEDVNPRAPSQRLALSPDGQRLAYVAAGPDARIRIWIRSLDGLAAQPLAGTDGAIGPFWSPDSRFVAFFSGGELKKIDISGGPPIVLSSVLLPGTSAAGAGPATTGMPGTWSQEDVILFSNGGPLARVSARVSARGGTPENITTLDADAKQTQHDFPHFLPDGRHFVYAAYSGLRPAGTYVGSLDGGAPVRLMDDSSNAQYSSGFLVFFRGTSLMAQRFDVVRRELSGEATPIVESVLPNLTARAGAGYSLSRTGALVYQTALGFGGARLIWSTRTGQQTPVVEEPAVYRDLSLSPDGSHAAISVLDERSRSDVWVIDLARGVRTRVTTTGTAQGAVWSPDGRTLLLNMTAAGNTEFIRKSADGGGAEQRVFTDNLFKTATDWSSDGQILYDAFLAQTNNDVLMRPVNASTDSTPIAATRFSERWAQFSPNRRWIAYTSDESGTREVYVTRHDGGGRWQVSAKGGTYPRWSHDGKELFFHAPAINKIVSARIGDGADKIEIGALTPLIEARPSEGFARYFYDVAPDGRFLLSTPISTSTSAIITLLVNWPALVENKR